MRISSWMVMVVMGLGVGARSVPAAAAGSLATDVANAVEALRAHYGAEGETAAQLQTQLMTQLAARRGEPVCASGGDCAVQLRTQVRASLQLAQEKGEAANRQDGVHLAAALMRMAGAGTDEVLAAGEMMRLQLRHQWSVRVIGEVSEELAALPKTPRWQQQARHVTKLCLGEQSCSPEEAQVALRVMAQVARRADTDARRVGRMTRQALREQVREARRADRPEQRAQKLQARLQARLQLRSSAAGNEGQGMAEQKRHQYRFRVNGEDRRGGDFGGAVSGGSGQGLGEGGVGPGNGGTSHGR